MMGLYVGRQGVLPDKGFGIICNGSILLTDFSSTFESDTEISIAVSLDRAMVLMGAFSSLEVAMIVWYQ